MNVLIVEDDIHLSEVLNEILISNDFLTDVVHDGISALDYATDSIYDVIVLDVMLPRMNGFEVVKYLRERKISTPVIMLTAKGEVSDRVMGLDCGADDYLTKPFAPEELLARIRASLRRQGEVVMDELSLSDISLNLSTHTLSTPHKSVNLNNKEFKLMRLLLSQPKNIVSKEIIIVKIWGYDSDVADNTIEAYISFLRKKLSYLDSSVAIKTVRKVGYKLEVADGD